MYQNYFKTALRNLWKNKGYSAINILGLAIGMSVALLIGLWVKFQVSVDSFHTNGEQIVVVMKKTFFNNVKGTQHGVMLPLYDELKASYPEVHRATRVDWGSSHGLIVGETRISKEGHYVDPEFLTMFTFPLVKGDVTKALFDPYSIVITESLASALFGEEEPMGKTIILDKNKELMVTGVLKDVPPNSTITFDFLMPFELNILSNEWVKNASTSWGNNFLQTFVELQPGVTPEAFSSRIENLLREKQNDPEESTFFVHPMAKWHLYSTFKDWVNTGGRIELVRLFAIIGILVLAIACINFMNLSTARSEKRAREVGIRKAIGSHRKQLIIQFLGESFITTLISFVIVLLAVQLALPFLEPLGFKDVSLDFTDLRLVGITFAACVATGLLAGWYPALYLSKFNAVQVLKGTFRLGGSGDLPRRILVVTQFTFSIALIIATLVVFLQIQHAKDRPLGYNPHNLISIYLTDDLRSHFDAMKEELLSTGVVESIGRASTPMTGIWNAWDGFSWEGMDPNSHPVFSAILADHDYEKTTGIIMKEGRFFDRALASDSSGVIINEATAKLIGFKDPIGRWINSESDSGHLTIIGVTQNVVMANPYAEVEPALIFLDDDGLQMAFIRLEEGVAVEHAIERIKPVVEKFNPAFPFDFRFTADAFLGKFSNEERVGKLAGIFAVLSIFISCLGLFGLASFMAERRTKEIGIRKVVGASTFVLWRMLSRDFVLLVTIACAIAVPIAHLLMNQWLGSYTYRANIPLWIPLSTGIGALTITLLTVSYQAIKAARMNPVNSLRTE
jgi:ABC-type antimicrobial peptide transport system permease subunit